MVQSINSITWYHGIRNKKTWILFSSAYLFAKLHTWYHKRLNESKGQMKNKKHLLIIIYSHPFINKELREYCQKLFNSTLADILFIACKVGVVKPFRFPGCDEFRTRSELIHEFENEIRLYAVCHHTSELLGL